ncbi:hypothetical protein FACS189454_08420 [Planctomycetales bacterium]|nr:hypothetical protein FACS189454_08420 [Planctomycetales bacterium]
MLQEIATGFSEYVASFPYFTCEFDIIDGLTDSREVAIAKGPSENCQHVKGVIVTDGVKKRYELFPTSDDYSPISSEMVPSGANSFFSQVFCDVPAQKNLTDGKLGLNIVLTQSAVQGIMQQINEGHFLTHEIDIFDPGLTLCPIVPPNQIQTRYTMNNVERCQMVVENERQLLEISLILGDTAHAVYVYKIDPKTGYLPIEFSMGNVANTEMPLIWTNITDFFSCSKGRFFPRRIVFVRYCDPKSNIFKYPEFVKGKYIVRELKVTKLDVDHPPLEKDFTISHHTDFRILDAVIPGSEVAIDANQPINIEDLPKIHESLQGKGVFEPHKPSTISWSWILINIILIVALLLSFYWRRKR